ncbi:hypothetical protein F4821DRAFT_278838 [Hypoxylon rubiginosum]|uniref:Uncharacterized protein n=1 Tax=Hypoxylon rubiginosum TaxID=110542 RepID=A0ACC0DIM4_9PEZI|nr:hypothetical protein F4821DRAFT_278838 [Hypoxylon rubiginosum]
MHRINDSPAWDPKIVLGLPNPEKGGKITCLGWAHTKGRRCWRGPSKARVSIALSILNGLGSASEAAASPVELRLALDILLCYHHLDQSSGILRQWKLKLGRCASSYGDEESSSASNKPSAGPRGVKSEPRVKKEDTEEDYFARYMPDHIKMENSNRQSQDQQRRREQKEKEDRQRREDEKKQEEKRRQQREEQRRQEQAREDAFRERVRLAREKIEREAREKAQKEAAEWQASWERYSDGWTKGADLSVANIAWPVKSGLQLDVDETNIKLFFEKAPPADLVDSGEKRLRLINAENKRWHTDKVMQRFGPDVINGTAKKALDIIAKVMVELRQEAQKKR